MIRHKLIIYPLLPISGHVLSYAQAKSVTSSASRQRIPLSFPVFPTLSHQTLFSHHLLLPRFSICALSQTPSLRNSRDAQKKEYRIAIRMTNCHRPFNTVQEQTRNGRQQEISRKNPGYIRNRKSLPNVMSLVTVVIRSYRHRSPSIRPDRSQTSPLTSSERKGYPPKSVAILRSMHFLLCCVSCTALLDMPGPVSAYEL